MRVISGSARGTHLKTIEGLDTRPTTDRIKENLFNLIQNEIRDTRVLDLFSGSGALAVEALSRGAREAVLVENSRKCYTVITENLTKTRLAARARVMQADVGQAMEKLAHSGQQFELVFMDPPYSKGLIVPVVERLQSLRLLTDDVWVIIEHEASDELPERIGGLHRLKHREYGRTSLSFYRGETVE